MNPIDDHLTHFGPEQRRALGAVRSVIRATLPAATKVISYGIPTFKVAVAFEGELAGYVRTKGSIHFDATAALCAPAPSAQQQEGSPAPMARATP